MEGYNVKIYWLRILSLFLLIVIVSLFFWLIRAHSVLLVAAGTSLGVLILITIYGFFQAHRKDSKDRKMMIRKMTIDFFGLLLAMATASFAGGWTGWLASQSAWDAGWPEWAVIVAGILAGFAAGFAAGLLVRFIWGRLFGPKRVRKAQAGEG